MRPNSPPQVSPLNPDELRILKDAQDVQALRNSPGFVKLRQMLDLIVRQALNDMRLNTNPHADAFYKLIWTTRESIVESIDNFIDSTVAKRREAVQEFLRGFGVSEELIAKNLDNPLDFLMPNILGGPNNGN